MKKYCMTTVKILLVVFLCTGVLVSCGDDDDDKDSTIMDAIANADPSYGFMVNSTQYRLVIDLGEEEEFEIALDPGMIIDMQLKERKTYILHVVVMNTRGRAISEYVNSFYIDEIPLDNQLGDFICSWYVEFTPNQPESGFANNFGT